MAERLNLSVDDGVGDLLTMLAGGDRQRGKFVSDLVRGMAQHRGPSSDDNEMLSLTVRALAGQVKALMGDVAILKAQYEQMQADS